ncbi:MAG: GNAT family N-acetyltransferase [Anaerolineaceae bacterium]|nr:GNAT family N-acetyltransferase [Anaerolineaceae bacterium]
MHIRQINTRSKQDVNVFVNFPFTLYEKSEYWVPPIISSVKNEMDKTKHPFYEHSAADFFIVESKNKVLGRIAILHNKNYCDYKNSRRAFVYHFDAVNDEQVSNLLFEKAVEWAKGRGLDHLYGPKGFLRSSGMGVLVKGFDLLPAMGIPYNYPYYEKLYKAAGFEKDLDHFSGFMTPDMHIDPRVFTIAEKVKKKGNYEILEFKNKSELRKWLPQVQEIQHKAFVDNPNYFPSTDNEFALIANSIIQIAKPELLKLILQGDKVVGFIISYPNISKALQKTKGKIWPLGWITILREKNKTQIVDFNGVGILPEYQGMGANALLYAELEKTIRKTNFKRGEFVQVNEDNFRSSSDWDHMGVTKNKIHRSMILKF